MLEQVEHQMLVVARKHFGQGGPKRIKHTLVPLVFRAIMLARRIKAQEEAGATPAVPSKKVLVVGVCAVALHSPHALS